ncbi:ArdC family protein [Stenotrophomonas pigmentata]|uniref:ArdC family protein n=1 Tax=Stenotrophomonas pigmentata TaxID=3055080 RepID=UPI0026EA8F3B|nr:zincin-like metallopeptidase domain-containing protein [Stenotrophomonas sp. 610A2]
MSRYDEWVNPAAEKIIALLEQDLAPWQKGWDPGKSPPGVGGMPYNAVSGRSYAGGNSMYLFAIAVEKGYDDNRWMTYDQATRAGFQVRKGEKHTKIAWWERPVAREKVREDSKDEQDKNDEERRGPIFRTFQVFNAAQIDGMPERVQRVVPDVDWRHNECERLLTDSGARINHDGGGRAFYRPISDSIHLPEKASFHTADNYYATALHELGHWTGHKDRLNRDLSGGFGSVEYAKEELRAEIASMMIGDRLGIGHDPTRHAAYVKSWIEVLKNEPKEVMRAASDAEKICTHLGIDAYQQEPIQVKERKQTQEQADVQDTAVAAMPKRPRARARPKQPEPVPTTVSKPRRKVKELALTM